MRVLLTQAVTGSLARKGPDLVDARSWTHERTGNDIAALAITQGANGAQATG